MTKKLVCLVLALLMVLAVLTSCGKEGDAAEETMNEASRYTNTFNLWMVTESAAIEKVSELMWNGFNAEVDYANYSELSAKDQKTHEDGKAIYDTLTAEEQAAVAQLGQINKAINKITKSKFKTQLKIRYLTVENYYAALEGAFAERQAAKDNGTLQSPSVSADETVLNEYGVPELKYPTTPGYQVDIMYVGEMQKYQQYATNGWLYALDGLIGEDAGKQLTYSINSVLLASAKYREVTYGIPSNNTIGEYIYLAVDEDLANSYGYDVSDFESSIFSNNCYDFLEYVYKAYMDPENSLQIKPIHCGENVDLEELNLLHFWNYEYDAKYGTYVLDPSEFSLFGSPYFSEATQGSELSNIVMATSYSYQQMLLKKLRYMSAEDYLTTDSDPDFEEKTAVRVVKGGLEERAKLEAAGYTVLTVKAPRATDESVFGNMFSIGAFTVDNVRCMEIITYLNTNAEFRNLVQYGIEDVNYTLESVKCQDGVTRKYAKMTESNVYAMDINTTGNVFVAYPNSEEAVMLWEHGKVQNEDAAAYPTVGMNFDLVTYTMDEKSVQIIKGISKSYKQLLDAVATEPGLSYEEKEEKLKALFPEDETPAELAKFLCEKAEGASYEYNGQTHTISEVDLKAALESMKKDKIDESKGALQSPYALYKYTWLSYYKKVS